MGESSHENLGRRDEDLKPGSERGFGLTMAVAFAVLAVLTVWFAAPAWAALWAGLAAAFATLALTAPKLLAPLNRVWFRFGLLLHKVMSPLVMALLFFGVITPIGLLMRLLGQRPLALDLDRRAASYWIVRPERSLEPGSMRKQY